MIKPIGDRVLIEPFIPGDKTSGGIIIPLSVKQKQNTGIVRAVGDGILFDEETILAVGDKVLYEENAGIEVEEDGVKCRLVRKGNVLLKLN